MRHEQAANLARALANAVRPERTAAQWRFWRWLARRRLADDERARSHLAHELTGLVEILVIPDEWMPESLGRRIVDGVMKALWMTESPGLRKYVKDVRATVMVDQLPSGQFLVNVCLGGESLRFQTTYRTELDAVQAGCAWVQRIGAVSPTSGRTRSVERVPEDANRDITGAPEVVAGEDQWDAEQRRVAAANTNPRGPGPRNGG